MRRCLIVSGAEPSATGAPDWRRFRMLAEHYRLSGLEVTALILRADPAGATAAAHLRASADRSAFASPDQAGAATRALDLRHNFDVIHVAAAHAPADICAGLGGVRLLDLPGNLTSVEALSGWRPHTDLYVGFEHADIGLCHEAGLDVVAAPYLRRAHRLSRSRITGTRLLAGLWVEAAPRAIAACRAFFDHVRDRGGGFAPNFIVAGPGATEIALPQLPFPIACLGPETAERAFYRGIDIAVCPDLGGAAPRYDVMTALELGATPIVSSSALTGVRSLWRLPHFEEMYGLAEYLFERGRDMREAGLMAELRARADWTWSSLSGAAADQRTALMASVKSKIQAIPEMSE
ncbi:MAG: hypothetical protein AAF367_12275 [Pseudomonadota bacterium]